MSAGQARSDNDTWLVVWAGDGDWPPLVESTCQRIRPRAEDAHHLLFRQEGGERWAALLVHWSAAERDRLVAEIGDRSAYHFVNAVLDLGER